jgi:succinyl-diaminopimelate desuccinylase
LNRTDRLDLLKQLIKFDTVGGKENEIAHFIQHFFEEHGIASNLLEVEPERFDVLAEIGNGQEQSL